ncbi:MAG: PAS domain-containing protein [Candidatus Omnitrophica bacterium]|nr:PAS domain-containing protein [Candidatus Omnitrophota bacterium]
MKKKKIISKQNKVKEPQIKDFTRSGLEKKISRQSAELRSKRGQLREGADREKFAQKEIDIRTKAMEFASDCIFIIDAIKSNFPIIYVNPSFFVLTGYLKHEVIGKSYFSLNGFDINLSIAQEIKQALLQGKSFYGEMLNSKKNGDKYWSLLRITPVRDNKGVITHYVGIKTDTTLMKRRDLEIHEQREELLHVTRVGKLAEFVSSLAHEISQPLAAILSYAEADQRILKKMETQLQESFATSKFSKKSEDSMPAQIQAYFPMLQEIIQNIINDDQRATGVIRRLRELLKKNKPTFEPVNINALIKDTVALMMTHITSKNKVINFELDSNLPMIQGDRVQLQQVLLNLISNSLEAMEERPESRDLLIKSFLKDAKTVMVQVRDSGCGIPVENMKKLFSHFFTSKPDGLGMGLSISRSIVEAHGGHLEAENNIDCGATFNFSLPIGIKENV